eukprot:4073033-Pleurochrysis_carterae.AAC.1
MPDSYESLLAAKMSALDVDSISEIAVSAGVADVLWRPNVQTPWNKCTLQRMTLERFQIWSEDGSKHLDEYVFGLDENGAPLDDSIQS